MNKLITILTLALALTSSRALVAQEKVPPAASPHISVAGTAVTEVTPDRLIWSLSLRNTGPELATVADSHSTLLTAVLKAVQDFGVETTDVQTSRMEFGENRVYKRNEHIKEGYFASTSISFKLADLGKYKDVWLRLASLSSLSVNSVSYDHSKRIDLQKETRKKALLAAREKAGAMAHTLDTRIGEVLTISEDLEAASNPYGSRLITSNIVNTSSSQLDDTDGSSIAPGTISIRTRVLVTFQLHPLGK